jgi:hypothetical protein
MKKILLIAIMAICTTGVFAANKNIASKKINSNSVPGISITIPLSCCTVTLTDADAMQALIRAAFFGAYSVISAYDAIACAPSTTAIC